MPENTDLCTFCVTYTIRNEEDTILDAIAAHMAMGASKVFVFFDGTTDGSREIVQGLEGVECFETLPPDELSLDVAVPEWFERIKSHFDTNMDVRKQFNTWLAAVKAREQGFDWLLCIDADEIFYPVGQDGKEMPAEAFFRSVDRKYDQVILRNLELVVDRNDVRDPFREGVYFLNRFPVSEEICRYLAAAVTRIFRSPKITEWTRYWFYMIRFRGLASRRLRHPASGRVAPIGYFLGYRSYKSAIRLSEAEQFIFGVHKWQEYTRKPVSLYRGYVLHYDLPNPDKVKQKFGQREKSIYLEKSYTRYMLNTIALESDFDVLEESFKQLCFDEKKLNSMIEKNIVSKINWTEKYLN
ncbi:glycosyltransferase family 2 protein [Martelella radicis]|uniref:Uncharacterized protein n=1 Tax=Martelella radicis TaxID=1397476 RepID=A0A7W6KKC4_9HYPH|nr:glycosyltransferase family 2 protein [Martelella radicis]MBB4122702.1 hypothetical protein [Martelella radicis]